MDNNERIECFLRNQMTTEEQVAFLCTLKKDKDLREETQMMALMIKEMKEEQQRQDNDVIHEVRTSSRTRIIRLTKWVGSIAAMLIILIGANQLYTGYRINKVFEYYYETYNPTSHRGGDDEDLLTELSDLYNKIGNEKNLAPVITRLQTIHDNIQSGNEDYADYKSYKNDIAWYLALAYIKDRNLEKARALLKPLADNGDLGAKELIKRISI